MHRLAEIEGDVAGGPGFPLDDHRLAGEQARRRAWSDSASGVSFAFFMSEAMESGSFRERSCPERNAGGEHGQGPHRVFPLAGRLDIRRLARARGRRSP